MSWVVNRLLATFRSNVLYQYGLQAAKYLFPFVTLPYLTRVLGPDTYAVRAYVLAAMMFVQVFLDYGFHFRGTQTIAINRGDINVIRKELTSIVILRLVLAFVVFVVLAAVIPFVPILADNPEYVMLAFLGTCLKAMLPDFVFQGYEDMGIITRRFVVSQLVATVLIFLMVRSPEDLLWIPGLELVAAFIAFVWSWGNVVARRQLRFVRVSISYLRHVFIASTTFFLSNAATVLFTSLTTLMIGVYVDDVQEVAYWSLAMTAVSAIQSLYNPLVNTLFPYVSARRKLGIVRKFLVYGVPLVLVASIAFALAADPMMWVLGGSEYRAGAYVFPLVAPVLLLSFPAMLLGYPVLGAMGRASSLTRSSLIAAAFHVSGLVVLAICGSVDILSVAILRSCTELLLLVVRVLFVHRMIGDFGGLEKTL